MIEINLQEIESRLNSPDENFFSTAREDISILVSQVRLLQNQMKICVEFMDRLYQDIESLKGEKIKIPDKILEKAKQMIGEKSFIDIVKMFHIDSKDLYIEIPVNLTHDDLGSLSIMREINLSSEDIVIKIPKTIFAIFPINFVRNDVEKTTFVFSIGHRCIHNENYWVQDMEFEIDRNKE